MVLHCGIKFGHRSWLNIFKWNSFVSVFARAGSATRRNDLQTSAEAPPLVAIGKLTNQMNKQ